MKKLLVAIVALLCTNLSYGKADEKQLSLTETSGLSCIFDNSKKANLKIEFAKDCIASYMGTTAVPFKQYTELNKEWNEEWADAQVGFSEDWTDRNKKGMTLTDGQADYTIKVTINNFKEMATFVGTWWEITDGTVSIVDNTTKKTVVAYKITEYYEICKGFKAMKLRNRIKSTLEGLSESCIVFAKKALK